MKKDKVHKQEPFRVPEGYFEQFPDRLRERMREEEVNPKIHAPGSRRIGNFRIAMAAAILAAALVSIPLLRSFLTNGNADEASRELVWLEDNGILERDLDLARSLEVGEDEMDEDEAYVAQAIEYLAMNDVEIDLIFE